MRKKVFDAVSVLDPAVDTESMTADELLVYVRERGDWRTQLKIKPGHKPTIYTLRHIPHSLFESYVMAVPGDAEVARRAFQCSVRRVQNLYQEDGTAIDYSPPGDTIPDEALERFSAAERIEMGQVAFQHSFLALRMQPDFRLPPTCLSVLTRLTFLPADASPSKQDQSSGEASSPSVTQECVLPETESGSSAPAGLSASPTAATVEVTP